jgi:hypothetical protein
MTLANTDFYLGETTFYQQLRVQVTGVTKLAQNNAPSMSFSGPGIVDASGQNNQGGRYGYVSFGIMLNGTIFWYPHFPLNYFNQVFEPQGLQCNCARIWLVPGVTAKYTADKFTALDVILEALVKVLVQKAATYKAPGGASNNTLPVPAPSPTALPGS